MAPDPAFDDPVPPAILRACGRLRAMDNASLMALADELMASNPDFLCHALALAKIGFPTAKVDGVFRVALFLELCYRERQGSPLPLFSPSVVAQHRAQTIRWIEKTSRLGEADAEAFRQEFCARYPQIHVSYWVFHLLQQASIIPPSHENDTMLVVAGFTLLSLYSSAFPQSPLPVI